MIILKKAFRRCFIVILPLFIGLVFAPLVAADDLIISRAALEDATGNLTIADVTGREFTPIGPTLSKGFKDSVHWLRLRVKAPAKGSEVVLLIRQPWLTEIRLERPAQVLEQQPHAGPVMAFLHHIQGLDGQHGGHRIPAGESE